MPWQGPGRNRISTGGSEGNQGSTRPMELFKYSVPDHHAKGRRGDGMNKSEEDRKNWLSRQADKIKAPRPEPEKRDELHTRKPDPRQGRRILSTWLNPAVIRQFKTLAFQ